MSAGRRLVAASFVWGALAWAPPVGPDALGLVRVESVSLEALSPTAGRSRWSIRVRVSNRGSKVASLVRFEVRIGKEQLPAYRRRAFLRPVQPGGVTEFPLYSFSSLDAPGENGPPSVEVRLTEASWFDIERGAAATETWTPVGKSQSLSAPAPVPDAPTPAAFAEVSRESGVAFVHHRAELDQRFEKIMKWVTSINAGIAAADYDGDGDVDLYLLNSRAGHANALFRNDGDWTFTEVAKEVGLDDVNHEGAVSMAAAFADVDNDGDPDLFIAGYGRSRLFRNDGGRFVDVSTQAGITPRTNAAAALFLDYDLDGWVDLMVGNYFDSVDLWNLPHTRVLPTSYMSARNGGPNLLFHNKGDGTFEEVGERLGVNDRGWTLALGGGDLDGDGDTDVYVANDWGPDLLYRNNGDGTFTDVSSPAIGPETSAGMNVDMADFDSDGDLDIFVTNITNQVLRQGNMLWVNHGDMFFVNLASETGIEDSGWGWAGRFLDFDNDGDLDLFTVSGFVSDGPVDIFRRPGRVSAAIVSDINDWPDMRGLSLSGYERQRLFRNDGERFAEVGREVGLDAVADGRGIVVADFDEDGTQDLLVSNCGGPAALYRNQQTRSRWLQVELQGTASNRDAIGARVVLVTGQRRQLREVDGGNGFSGQSPRIVHFGFGPSEKPERLEIRWPSGRRFVLERPPANTRVVVAE
jgi:hypothetical protein